MLPIAVIVQFDKDDYIGPSFCENMPNCVPIFPVTSHINDTMEQISKDSSCHKNLLGS